MASFFASRMPLVNQQRSPHTSRQTTFTGPRRVRSVARTGRSFRSKVMDTMRVFIGGDEWGRVSRYQHSPGPVLPSPSLIVTFVTLDAHALERAQRLPHTLDFPLAGFLFAACLLEQFAEFTEARDGATELASDLRKLVRNAKA